MAPSASWVTLAGMKKSNESVKLATVPNNHLTTANVNAPGRMTANPVKKLPRHRAKRLFCSIGSIKTEKGKIKKEKGNSDDVEMLKRFGPSSRQERSRWQRFQKFCA